MRAMRAMVGAVMVAAVVGAVGVHWSMGQGPPTQPFSVPIPAIAAGGEAVPTTVAKKSDKLALSVERVVVFKDGYGLILKRGVATADAEGRVYTPEVPDAAVLGTFWAASADSQKILAMKAEWDESRTMRKTPVPCLTVRDILRGNAGKRVTLSVGTEKTAARSVTGVVGQVLEEKTPTGTTLAAPVGGATYTFEASRTGSPFDELALPQSTGTLVRELPQRGGEYVVIEGTEGGKMVLPVSQVQSVSGADVVTQGTREEEVIQRTKRLSFDFGKEAAGKEVKLQLFYFTPGLRWVPTYRLSGDLKEKAELSLQGEVINEVEDIGNAAVDLVVGVPNFRFKDSISPLSLERAARMSANEAIVFGNNDGRNNGLLNAQFRQDDNRGMAVRPGAADPAPELVGSAGEQDLFVYPLKGFSLKKGARASAPLWQADTSLRHLYTYDVKARRSRSTGGMIKGVENPSDQRRVQTNSIWHQLELKNESKTPWTTGAALMLQGTLPVGQDMLMYTPVGATTLLPVTVAVELRGTTDEEEVERANNALQVEGYSYALVRKKGEIKVTNYRKEKSSMRVTLSTGGKVEKVSDDGKIKLNDFRSEDWDESSYMRPNNHSDVVWEMELEAGKSKVITYVVSSYAR